MIDLLAALAAAAAQPSPCALPQDPSHQGAAALAWFRNGEEIAFKGKPFRKYGLPRVLTPPEVKPVATYKGGWIFRDFFSILGGPPPADEELDIVYVPVRIEHCEFQPYTLRK
jgi:hypothetical protein